jgi:hypothetical protein
MLENNNQGDPQKNGKNKTIPHLLFILTNLLFICYSFPQKTIRHFHFWDLLWSHTGQVAADL